MKTLLLATLAGALLLFGAGALQAHSEPAAIDASRARRLAAPAALGGSILVAVRHRAAHASTEAVPIPI
jgi:hypothetical protein